jgi:hypothetical protein
MCTVLLPPGVNPIVVKYIISYIISYHTISHHTIPYHTISYHIIPYHIISEDGIFQKHIKFIVLRYGVDGITTRCGLGASGIESRWEIDFPHSSKLALGPTQYFIGWEPALLPRGKAAGHGFNHPIPSSVEVKETVQL